MSDRSDEAQAIQLLVQLSGDESIDDVSLDDLSRSLRRELEDLRFVTDVDQRVGTDQSNTMPPKGTKAGEWLALGALLMAVLPEALPEAIAFLKEWALRPGNHHVKIKVQSHSSSVEIEFDPRTISKNEVMRLVTGMKAQIRPQK
jgi:hypothetical protein